MKLEIHNYYIPILSTLTQLLQDASILEEVDQSSKRVHQDGFIEDFCDGSRFKTHPLFSEDPSALQIIAYYDELEVCNPLGSHTKKRKLEIVFFTLANIRPCYRSQLKIINLAIVATSPDIEKHTLDQVLEPFNSDLNTLATSGITVEVEGTSRPLLRVHTLHFCLIILQVMSLVVLRSLFFFFSLVPYMLRGH